MDLIRLEDAIKRLALDDESESECLTLEETVLVRRSSAANSVSNSPSWLHMIETEAGPVQQSQLPLNDEGYNDLFKSEGYATKSDKCSSKKSLDEDKEKTAEIDILNMSSANDRYTGAEERTNEHELFLDDITDNLIKHVRPYLHEGMI
ncbi:unnamed protein product [Didymodactylos carnosus]|uniref:Uncharacterized protein n=1 Tax=Didymodactylos carnosus TaxID=1234261 RepID=A0A815ESQ3_9BILA|nr:unnamed protein product [Didymodactylos carnosus]CAF4154654.1 unnamed protein product [Didymodactylos carnosus]